MSDKKTCPNCGAEVDAERIVCPHCNRTLPEAGAAPRAEAEQGQPAATQPPEPDREFPGGSGPRAEEGPAGDLPPQQRPDQPPQEPAAGPPADESAAGEPQPAQPPTRPPAEPSQRGPYQPPPPAQQPPADASAPPPQWQQAAPPQQQWPPPDYPVQPPPPQSDSLGVVGLVLSILGTLGAFCGCPGILAPIGLTLSAISHTRRSNAVTLAGIIVGIVGTLLFLVTMAFYVYLQMHPEAYNQIMRQMLRQFPGPSRPPF